MNQPTDNVDNNNDNNTTKLRTISGLFLDYFGLLPIVSAIIYVKYMYIFIYVIYVKYMYIFIYITYISIYIYILHILHI